MKKEYSKYKNNRDVLSFFSGGMGLDNGLMKAGLNVAMCQEFDEKCVQTIRKNGHKVIAGDIRDVDPKSVLEKAGLSKSEPFLICGGPPCQPFSTAGKRLGINDPRGSLFMDFTRMIDYIRPRFFVMENVKGLLSAELKSDEKHNAEGYKKVIDVVLAEFDKLGYKTVYGILDAVNYGAPQFRERFILIGSRDNESIFLPYPTNFPTHQNAEHRWRTVGDAIADLQGKPVGECGKLTEERKQYIDMVPEGGNWRDLPEDVVEKAMGGAFESGGGKVGFYRRLSFSQPSPTVTTSPGQKATLLCHPTENRLLSVREYARLQQFPDKWEFCGTIADKYKQIGNAVPVGLAEAIGNMFISVADDSATVKTKRFRGTAVHDKIQDALVLGGNEYGPNK